MSKKTPPVRRPRGVVIIAALLLTQAAVWTATGTLYFSELPVFRLPAMETSAFALALAAVNLIVAVGMLFLRPWAWVGAMTVQGLSLGAGLWSYSLGDRDYPLMVISVMAVLYLNLREVRRPFGLEDLKLGWNEEPEEPGDLL
ncbi:MAG TPA: hypothetical protein VFE20_03985 [Thermoleophilia bacterium]|nr:hypothetical protein [Thermoleophilia bacterium]